METLIKFLSDYWSIIISIIAVVISYTTLKYQNIEQERRINCLEVELKNINPVLVDIRTKLASIETTLKILTK